jgi:lysine-N-methylase
LLTAVLPDSRFTFGLAMSFPIHHLPVLQNWDCQATGSCCKEYLVAITEEERQRIESQNWNAKKDLGGLPPLKRFGPFWARRYVLNHRPDGSCVFLGETGRCRIHEKHGYEAKPLPCRLFPFVLVPQGDRWAVGIRYACPSAARNKGRPLPQHDELRDFAEQLARQAGLTAQPDTALSPAPPLSGGVRIEWPDLRRHLDALLVLLANRKDRMERRLRKCLAFVAQCKQAQNMHELTGTRLGETLGLSGPPRRRRKPPSPRS